MRCVCTTRINLPCLERKDERRSKRKLPRSGARNPLSRIVRGRASSPKVMENKRAHSGKYSRGVPLRRRGPKYPKGSSSATSISAVSCLVPDLIISLGCISLLPIQLLHSLGKDHREETQQGKRKGARHTYTSTPRNLTSFDSRISLDGLPPQHMAKTQYAASS